MSIIDSIISTEKKANTVLADAQTQVKQLQIQTEQQLFQLQQEAKTAAREAWLQNRQQVAEQQAKELIKINKKIEKDLAELQQKAQSNFKKIKRQVLQKLLA